MTFSDLQPKLKWKYILTLNWVTLSAACLFKHVNWSADTDQIDFLYYSDSVQVDRFPGVGFHWFIRWDVFACVFSDVSYKYVWNQRLYWCGFSQVDSLIRFCMCFLRFLQKEHLNWEAAPVWGFTGSFIEMLLHVFPQISPKSTSEITKTALVGFFTRVGPYMIA